MATFPAFTGRGRRPFMYYFKQKQLPDIHIIAPIKNIEMREFKTTGSKKIIFVSNLHHTKIADFTVYMFIF